MPLFYSLISLLVYCYFLQYPTFYFLYKFFSIIFIKLPVLAAAPDMPPRSPFLFLTGTYSFLKNIHKTLDIFLLLLYLIKFLHPCGLLWTPLYLSFCYFSLRLIFICLLINLISTFFLVLLFLFLYELSCPRCSSRQPPFPIVIPVLFNKLFL